MMEFLRLSKISIYSFIMIILFSLGMYGFISSLPFWTPEYMDLNYNHIDKNALDINIQFYRILAYACLVLSILIWILSFLNILKIDNKETKRIYLFSIGIFTWLLLPFTIWKCIKEKYYQEYFKYISIDYTETNSISFGSLKKFKLNHLFFNTLFCIFVWLLSIVGAIFLFVNTYFYDKENPKNNFLIGEMSYFTNLSNWGIFIFMSLYLFFNKKNAFKNNTLMIGMSSYIFVVFLIFWVALFPYTAEGIEKQYRLSTNGPTGLISTIWVHAITPIFFICFSISTFILNKEKPNSYLTSLSKLIIFPFVYGVYIFILPFFSQFSVYGDITNLNPNCTPYYDAVYNDEVHNPGSLNALVVLFGLFALFIFIIFVFWVIAIKSSKNSIKNNIR